MNAHESQLDARSARVLAAYDPEGFARQAAAAATLVRDHLAGAFEARRAVWPGTSPQALLDAWPDPAGAPVVTLERLLEDFLAGSTAQHHPGFVGQQLSTPPPLVGPVALVASIVNNSAAIFEGAPVAVAIERRVVDWMMRKVGYGDEAAGILTSGGSLGALTALLAMRQAKIGTDVWRDGLAGDAPAAVLMSGEAHYCNRRACAVLGFGERAVFSVPADQRFAMDTRALAGVYRDAVSAGFRPVALVANAGSTATGTYDNLVAAAEFCETRDLWLHVDAAHGGAALLSPRHAGRFMAAQDRSGRKYGVGLRGIARADSIVWDAHKMLLMPSLCTGVLFRRAAHLDATFRQQASYLLAGDATPWYQPASRNFETTKPALGLPLYVTLRTLGEAFLAEHVEYAYDLARAFADEIEGRESFELLVRPESNIVCFRRRAESGTGADALQVRLREAINRAGRFFIMRTTIAGATWLRVVLMNPATRVSHLRALLDELEAI